MRPYPEEVLKAIQNVTMQHFGPELTSPFSQRELMIVGLMFSIAGRGRDTEVPDLIEENRTLREILGEANSALSQITHADAEAAREAIAALPRTETSLKLSDLRRENDALRAALASLAPLIEPAAEDAALAPLRDVRAKAYAHLKADAARRQVPMLG
jgi:hypothetical protein